MRPLDAGEYEQCPTYLLSQLSLPLERVNECIEAVNNVVTDKRFVRAISLLNQPPQSASSISLINPH